MLAALLRLLDQHNRRALAALQLRVAQVSHDQHGVQLARIIVRGQIPKFRVRRLLLLVRCARPLPRVGIVVVDG